MSKTLGFKWLVGGVVGVSLLGACGAPADSAEEIAAEQQATTGEVAVSLSVEKSALSAREDVAVKVTFTNISSEPVRLLSFYIPDGTLKEGLFEVARNGEPVEYIGPQIKRAAPGAEDYVTLAPGESISGVAPVSGFYDLSESGTYSISYAARSLDQHSALLSKAAQLDSNLVNLWIEGRESGQPELQAQGTVSAQGLSFSGACTSSEQSSITTAVSNAKTYSNNASTYLNGISLGHHALHHLVRLLHERPADHGAQPLHQHQERLRQRGGRGRLQLQPELLRLRVPGLAVQDLRVQRFLERPRDGHGLQGRHAGPRDEPLQRGGGHG